MDRELHPDTWTGYRFGHGLTVLDFQVGGYRVRVSRGLDRMLAAAPT
ncbi:hypothetical protein F4561_005210 [Lipingzhangella halophila]|uniref:Uncharacterized protein n=1 Tax=Lipingzhangella halophila TaxID=1783352 RepID=A0A7W7RLW2_9ACTN|nr:hypothetical protein [Lipingzhangella halophila]